MKLTLKEIQINNANKDEMIKKCKWFINKIENDFDAFQNNLEKLSKKYNPKKNSIIVNFIPEELRIKSCLTIIDGKWGTGKTFFIERLFQLIDEEEIKLNVIKKIIYIDALHFSSHSNIPDLFIIEILNKLNIKNKEKIRKIIGTIILPWANKLLSTELKLDELNQEDYIKQIDDFNNEPTLIVVDNIERIGANSWDIIRSIQKLLIIKNLLFLLPINIKKIDSEITENAKSKFAELHIRKYINIDAYSFQQDYSSILNEKGVEKKYIQILNHCLQISVNNCQLSIRELKFIDMEETNNFFEKSKYHGLIKFLNIWDVKDHILLEIENDVNMFFEKWVKLFENTIQIINEIKNNEIISDLENIIKIEDQNNILENWVKQYKDFLSMYEYIDNNNQIIDWTIKLSKILREYKNVKKYIRNKNANKNIDKVNKKLENEKENYKNNKNKFEKMKNEYLSKGVNSIWTIPYENYWYNNSELTALDNKLNNINENINKIKIEIENLNKYKSFEENKNYDSWVSNCLNKIKLYETKIDRIRKNNNESIILDHFILSDILNKPTNTNINLDTLKISRQIFNNIKKDMN